ncbi:MAG: hypothetical protein M0R75_15600 [Dehalococcoidia bacterium]|nr:hypothetical protein [Dehalococcoidia bacterium]
MVLTRIRDICLTITAVAGAAAVLFALADRAGPMATLAIASALGMLAIVVAGQRAYRWGQTLSQTVEDVRYHLGSNGEPLHDRVTHLQASAEAIQGRLERGDRWMDEHVRTMHAVRAERRVR